MKKALAIITLTLALCVSDLMAWSDLWHPLAPGREKNDIGRLYFGVNGSMFFINNEYFGDIVEGYTMPGHYVEPYAKYNLSDCFSLKAGFNILKYYGMDEDAEFYPVLAATIRFNEKLELTMGGIDANTDYDLSDILVYKEDNYRDPVNNGFQLRYLGGSFKGSAWISWDQFIRKGDTIPEIFTAGANLRPTLLKSESGWNIDVPLQMTAFHRGGQISDFSEKGASIINLLGGIEAGKDLNGRLDYLELFVHYLIYKDLKEENSMGINKGNAFFGGVNLGAGSFEFLVAYWSGKDFISTQGNPMFGSASDYKPYLDLSKREMLRSQLMWSRFVTERAVFSLLLDSYYDTRRSQFDYGWGLHISFAL